MRGHGPWAGLWGLALLLVILMKGVAAGEERVALAGSADGCPTPEAVAAYLRQVLPGVSVVGQAGHPAGARLAEVRDLGPRYRVSVAGGGTVAGGTVAGGEKEFTDEPRRCQERARAAAVFIAVVLSPLLTDPKPERAAPASPPAQQGPRRRRPRVELEIGAVLAAAPRLDGAAVPLAGGVGVRVAAGAGPLLLTLGISALSPVTLALSGATAQMLRLPLDLSLRGTLRRGRVEGAADVGLMLAMLLLQGMDPRAAGPAFRVDPGVRLAAALRVWVGRLAPFAALQAGVSPRPYDLQLDPQGIVGHTPVLWLEASAGLLVRLQ